ncbi:Anaphase-promoting complex subunit 5 [Thoreauomyces humboldtii]|nr:Anaphase-promoting complex subunit 5 [Thoreauomyces humboldtii]
MQGFPSPAAEPVSQQLPTPSAAAPPWGSGKASGEGPWSQGGVHAHGSGGGGTLWLLSLTPHKLAVLALFEKYLIDLDQESGRVKYPVTALLLEQIGSLNDAAASLEGLFQFFSEIEAVTMREDELTSRFNPATPFGTYIKLTMNDLNDLKRDPPSAFVFLQAMREYLRDGQPVEEEIVSRKPSNSVRSLLDSERALDAEVKALADNTSDLSPEDLQRRIEHLRRTPVDPRADWTSYLNCLRANDYQGSLQSLQRYFMHSTKDDGQNWVHHYGLLNTACLYARFNHRELALETIDRAIPLAQGMNDTPCLTILRNLKHRLKRMPNNRVHEKRFELTTAATADQVSAEDAPQRSVDDLNIARQNLETACDPMSVFICLTSSLNLNIHHSIEEVSGTERLLRADVWKQYGNSTLAALYADLYITYDRDHSADDKPLGLCLLAQHHATQGNHKMALDVLETAKRLYPPFVSGTASDKWMATLLDIMFQRALRRNELRHAELYTSQYAAIAEGNADMSSAVALQGALLARRWGRPDEAFRSISEISDSAARGSLPDTRMLVECNLQLADLHLEANDAASALRLALSSITLSSQHSLRPHHERALITAASCMTTLGLRDQARRTLDAVMPRIHSIADPSLSAEAALVDATSILDLHAHDPPRFRTLRPDGDLKAVVMPSIEDAAAEFERLEDLSGLERTATLRVIVCLRCGDVEAAEEMVKEVERLEEVMMRRRNEPVLKDGARRIVDVTKGALKMADVFL